MDQGAKPQERQFRAVAVLSVAACTTTVADLDVGSVAKGLLKGDGFELTRANDLIQLPGAPLRTIPGDVLARLPRAAAWFTSTWSALRFERERAWRARRHSRGNPAEIMGLWGLGAIESFVMRGQAQPGDAPEMWRAVERAFREARLVEPRLGRDFWSQAVARLFGWWPQVFAAIQDRPIVRSGSPGPWGSVERLRPTRRLAATSWRSSSACDRRGRRPRCSTMRSVRRAMSCCG